MAYQPFAPAPHRTLWIAPRYLDVARQLYGAASLDRSLQVANDSTASRTTSATASFNKRRGLQHLHVAVIGTDFARAIAAASNAAAAVSHVDLCLDDPGIAFAVEALRKQGYFFCALLPEFAHTDVLRMQRLTFPTAGSFAPKLANAGAVELLARMRREYEAPANTF